MTGGTEETHPTEQEVTDWFKENFGLAVFPSEARKEWVKRHWRECGTKQGEGRELEDGQDRKLLETLCPDLIRYFEAAPEGVYVIAEPRPAEFEVEYNRTEITALKNKVEELQALVYHLALENESLKRGQNLPQVREEDQ